MALPEDVAAILDSQYLDEDSSNDSNDPYGLQPFLTTAEALTDTLTDLTANLTEQCTIWLAAHFYMIKAQALKSEKLGDAEDEYQHKLGLNLQVTMYGQQAMMLDITGELRGMNSSKSKNQVSIEWMAGPGAEETT